MRPPLDSYGPEPEMDLHPGARDRFRWLQWAQLVVTSALLVLFAKQLLELQDVNRRIARLYERMDLIESSRLTDTTPALEAQQRTILERLTQLEASLREIEPDGSSSESSGGAAALQPPPPPPPPSP